MELQWQGLSFICKFIGIKCWYPHENKVLNLKLSDMGLRFHWGIKNYTSLTGLDLSNNDLLGPPLLFYIAELVSSLTSFYLSINRFSGEIPNNFVNCSYLNVLKLDQNQLIGEIPPELGIPSRIKTFGVSNNILSGVVPYFVDANVLANCLANNKELSQTL